jgi:hypothetical protein
VIRRIFLNYSIHLFLLTIRNAIPSETTPSNGRSGDFGVSVGFWGTLAANGAGTVWLTTTEAAFSAYRKTSLFTEVFMG